MKILVSCFHCLTFFYRACLSCLSFSDSSNYWFVLLRPVITFQGSFLWLSLSSHFVSVFTTLALPIFSLFFFSFCITLFLVLFTSIHLARIVSYLPRFSQTLLQFLVFSLLFLSLVLCISLFSLPPSLVLPPLLAHEKNRQWASVKMNLFCDCLLSRQTRKRWVCPGGAPLFFPGQSPPCLH